MPWIEPSIANKTTFKNYALVIVLFGLKLPSVYPLILPRPTNFSILLLAQYPSISFNFTTPFYLKSIFTAFSSNLIPKFYFATIIAASTFSTPCKPLIVLYALNTISTTSLLVLLPL